MHVLVVLGPVDVVHELGAVTMDYSVGTTRGVLPGYQPTAQASLTLRPGLINSPSGLITRLTGLITRLTGLITRPCRHPVPVRAGIQYPSIKQFYGVSPF